MDARIRGGRDWAEQAEHGGLDNSNWKTPVLIYSSAGGAYAGANLEGSRISTDDQTMRDLHVQNATLQTIFGGFADRTVGIIMHFVARLRFPRFLVSKLNGYRFLIFHLRLFVHDCPFRSKVKLAALLISAPCDRKLRSEPESSRPRFRWLTT